MNHLRPFADVDSRTAWLRSTLLLATFLGLIASAPVWSNTRRYPLAPLAGFPIVPAPWDNVLFGLMLVALVAACWSWRLSVGTFLTLCLIAFLGDQNRGQPWLYMYWVMLLLTLLPTKTAHAGCRWALATVYLWAGIQKCHALYFQKIGWFVEPAATQWHWPAALVEALRWAAASAPFIEIAIAVSLWLGATRRFALAAVVAVHLFALLFLGPLGHNYNWVVWPWNLAMMALALVLFPTGKAEHSNESSPTGSWSALRGSKFALAVLVPFTLLPALSYQGLWPSQFSFALYSESNATANIFITQSTVDRLPADLRRFVVPFPNYDPQHQGPFLFNSAAWAYEEMHVPPASEPRAFRTIFNALRPYAPESADLRMIIGERGGRVMFYQDDQSWELKTQ